MRSILSHAAVTFRHFLQDSAENAARGVARWAKGVATLYVVAAALTLIAGFALASGLAWGMVALGLPPYAAWLIVAAGLGLTGYGLSRAAGRKKVTREEEDEDRPGLTIRIVKRAPRRKPRTRRRTVVVAHPKARAVIHRRVHPN